MIIEQQPIMIYQNAEEQQPIIIDQREKCSCPELNHDHPSSDLSTTTNTTCHPTLQQHNPQHHNSNNSNTNSNSNSNNNSGNVTPINPSSENNHHNNYTSWAVVTPQQEPFLPNQDPVNLGFIFHKPSSQRYLNGQPRPPRKKSIKKQRPPSPHQLTNLTCTTPLSSSSSTSTTTTVPIKSEYASQQDFILPLMDLDNLPTTPSTTNNHHPTLHTNHTNNNNNNNNSNNIYDYDSLIPTSTADLNAILNNVLKPMQEEFKSDEEYMNQELANLDLTSSSMYNNNQTSSRSSSISISNNNNNNNTNNNNNNTNNNNNNNTSPNHSTIITTTTTINNNMIPILSSPSNSSTTTNMTINSSPTTSMNGNHSFFPTMTNMPININPAAISSSSTSSTPLPPTTSTFDQISCCNQHSSDGTTATTVGNIGESVVITITPLNESHHPLQGNQNQVRTRIMTCYCGSQCQCPGCLIHPGNFLIGDQYYNPFNGFPTTSSTCPSSTASSTYSVSDDEDHFHLL
ncbi:unnamed protein product [Cunninghamella blakesleeana]